jgi:hypothetical protein
VFGPHDREYAELGIAGLSSKKLLYPVVFVVGESVASNEFGSNNGFSHRGFEKPGGKELTDMLPDEVRLIKESPD